MATEVCDDLFPETRNPACTLAINDRCLIRTQNDHRVVVVGGMTLAQYDIHDSMSEALAMVNLVQQGWADQNDVARAFGRSARTLRRYQARFEDRGLSALGSSDGYPKGRPRLAATQTQLIQRLKASGHSNREIARQVGVSEMAIRKSLRRMGWKEPEAQGRLPLPEPEGANPNLSAFSTTTMAESPAAGPQLAPVVAPTISADLDPADRRVDRFLARVGLLQDAAPVFGSAKNLPRAGVLLAVPALVQSGVFSCAQKVYQSLGPAFYGLRTSILTLLLMALWRIKRPKAIKEHCPEALGRVLGLDRAPEVKTLRRKLTRLAAAGHAAQFGQALAQERVAQRASALGFLYVDGHVRVYHGQRRLPKAHVARMRLSMPATTDYWVNDSAGDPLFVVTAEDNAGLVKMLPAVLEEVRRLVGDRRVTFVFDRGGYSPKLFLQIVAAGFDLLTYRKGRYPAIPKARFRPCTTVQDGRTIRYVLADQEVRLLKGKLRLRQITRLMENGHRTPILTSLRGVPPALLAYRMFERWRQENFFKYLREEFALDALADHAEVPDDPTREVPNPAWAAAEAKLQQALAEEDRLQAQYGLEAMLNSERERATMRGFKIAQSKLSKKIENVSRRITALYRKRDKIPRRVPLQSICAEPIVKLAPERKHLTNLLKMVAFQAESDLFRIVSEHYARAEEEGRTLIQSALASAADLDVTQTTLRVTLVPLSSPHRTKAIGALCEKLNQANTTFPGSSLRMRFAIHPNP